MKKKRSVKSRKKVTGAQEWLGQLEGHINGCLYGWVLNKQNLEQRVSLEVCLDQEVVGLVSANLLHSNLPDDLKELLRKSGADFCHGFIAEIGKLHPQVNYTVRVANTSNYIDGQIRLNDDKDEEVSHLNLVYSDGGLRLHGYSMSSGNEFGFDSVFAYLENEQLATAKANLQLPSLRGHLFDGYGFQLNLPLTLADGQLHQITVLNNSGKELNGSPIQVCCFSGGVQSILPNTASDLCKRLMSSYEGFLPRSVATTYYKEWREQFGLVQPSIPQQFKSMRLAVMYSNDDDAEGLAKSRKSLGVLKNLAQIEILEVLPNQSGIFRQNLDSEFLQTDFTLYLRVGDTIVAENLLHMLVQTRDAVMSYGDAEYLDHPWFKPAWNLEYALASDYFLSGVICRTEFLNRIILSRPDVTDPALWYWAAALTLDKQSQDSIQHFPYVVYHLNKPVNNRESFALCQQLNQLLATEIRGTELQAISPKNSRQQLNPLRKLIRTQSVLTKDLKVCLIIPTRDQCELLTQCIESIQEFTTWPALQIIVVDNGSTQTETKTYLQELRNKGIKVIEKPGPFNFSQLNNDAVALTDADIIGLVNNDIEAIHHGWIEEMLSHFSDPRVAMVGAKLLWPNGMVQHGGVIIGMGGLAAHYGNLLHDDDAGEFGRNQVTQQLSAVTAACLLVRKSDWQRVGGLNEADFPVAFNDVDLCLKLRALGRHIIWTPFARLLHVESASRGKEDSPQKQARAQREMANLRRRWGAALLQDPSYHPGLNLDAHAQVYTGLALPPRYRYLRHNRLQAIPLACLEELGIRGNQNDV